MRFFVEGGNKINRRRRKLKEPERGQYKILFKKFRNFRHMTQDELAFLADVAPSYISMFEQDNRTRTRSPKLNLIRDISYAMRICPNDMVFFPCLNCELNETCVRKKYVQQDEEEFFESNLKYYLE